MTPIVIINDDASTVEAARKQETDPTPSVSATPVQAPIPQPTLDCAILHALTDQKQCKAFLTKLYTKDSNGVSIPRTASGIPSSAPPAAKPSDASKPEDQGGAVTASALESIDDLLGHVQANMVSQFERREVPVITQQRFSDLCLHNNTSDPNGVPTALALHWTLIDPDTNLDTQWAFFGYTSSSVTIYWHLVTCDPNQEVLLDGAMPNQTFRPTIYRRSEGTNFQQRAPTDFLTDIISLLTMFHPSGKALVGLGVSSSVTAVSGGLNLLLSTAYGAHDVVVDTTKIAAARVAETYCAAGKTVKCGKTR